MSYAKVTFGEAREWRGGIGTLQVGGSFAGETVSLEYSMDGGTGWVVAGAEAVFTAAGSVNFELPPCLVRVSVAGGAGAGINAYLSGQYR